MAEIGGDLIYEILKKIKADISVLKGGQRGIREEIVSVRVHAMGMQNDINNIYGTTARIEQRLDRIENRLELRELSETQRPFDPNS